MIYLYSRKCFGCFFHMTKLTNNKLINALSLQFSRELSKLTECDIKIAVIGSGPSGFYTTQQLIKDPRITVDIYEKFPVPFGLVRFGVAPDHPEVKNVINSFTNIALNNRTSFIGNVSIGTDITLKELRDAYNAVVLCYGASIDRMLNIEGENLPNVLSARRFVGWYNGVPQDKDLMVNLNCNTAVIIGHGNVALDCARILLTPVDDVLKNTDITSHSLNLLRNSKVNTVYIIGRRGPLQVSFTIKEFREMIKLKNCDTIVSPKDFEAINSEVIDSLLRPRKRLTELLMKASQTKHSEITSKNRCIIKFFQSPHAIYGDKENGISHISLRVNKLDGEVFSENAKTIPTDQYDEIPCGLVLRSIGYKAISIDPSLPFDNAKGIIKNENGRVIDCGPGLYCSGWTGSGATGVILNTMNNSFDVGRLIIDDINNNVLNLEQRHGSKYILDVLKNRGVEVITFSDWQRIDQLELNLGSLNNKPREKFVDIKQMIDAAKSKHK